MSASCTFELLSLLPLALGTLYLRVSWQESWGIHREILRACITSVYESVSPPSSFAVLFSRELPTTYVFRLPTFHGCFLTLGELILHDLSLAFFPLRSTDTFTELSGPCRLAITDLVTSSRGISVSLKDQAPGGQPKSTGSSLSILGYGKGSPSTGSTVALVQLPFVPFRKWLPVTFLDEVESLNLSPGMSSPYFYIALD
ncbi:hypothetical protein GOBAR_AA24138 [Gossypium barbadense]|uniref:Uncharacterized protein n=1 Tax=Gossypium barbadense TaxID=3634 RepID=A0A2P5WZL1_GOSBA|nr:hypothetical protein GOBAR_AA24138 [Gossypium barbadense]